MSGSNFVISKTPTQVASHAQKYFIRLNSIKNSAVPLADLAASAVPKKPASTKAGGGGGGGKRRRGVNLLELIQGVSNVE